MQVLVRDNNVDQALKALKKKMQREGIFREMKLRGHYEKPSESKAREKAEAIRRARKLARKRLQREGLLPMKPKPTGPGAGGGQVRTAAAAALWLRISRRSRASRRGLLARAIVLAGYRTYLSPALAIWNQSCGAAAGPRACGCPEQRIEDQRPTAAGARRADRGVRACCSARAP